MERLFVDTSAWFAYVNRSDPSHEAVADLLLRFEGRLVTSNFVFDETVSLCRYRLGHRPATVVGEILREPEVVDLIRVTPEDEAAAWDLFVMRRDQTCSFTDCTSFALLQRLGMSTVAALDQDFRTEGFEVHPAV